MNDERGTMNDGEAVGASSSFILHRSSFDAQLIREALAALDMPPEGLRNWFEHNKAFCNGHGGERLYREWLDLYDVALDALNDAEANGSSFILHRSSLNSEDDHAP